MGRRAFQEGFKRTFMRVCMGWHAFQEGLRRTFMRVCCIPRGIEKDIHEGLHGLACIPRGIEKDIHEGCAWALASGTCSPLGTAVMQSSWGLTGSFRLSRGMHQRQLDGARVRWGDRLRSQAEAIAASLGPWTASARGLARRGSAFRSEAPAEARTKGLHDLRTDWRCSQMKRWLGSMRIDAVMARGQGLRITPHLADLLHKSAGRLDAYAVGVLTGGFKSPALGFKNGGAILQNCPFCGNAAVPGLEHCLWWCEAFAHFRAINKPRSPLAARLGWDCSGIHPALTQMAQIRKPILALTKSDLGTKAHQRTKCT